jgi:hypothetical protein
MNFVIIFSLGYLNDFLIFSFFNGQRFLSLRIINLTEVMSGRESKVLEVLLCGQVNLFTGCDKCFQAFSFHLICKWQSIIQWVLRLV